MRQIYRAGEKAFVDYSGKRPTVVDPESGEQRQVELFVAVLGASNFTYAEATWTQRSGDFIASHVRTLEYWGGVPALIVPDQLRTGVSGPHRYEPGIQKTYDEMAEHYGTAVLPARPRSPRDKAKVEVGVQIAQRWILARLRNETFFSLVALNERIWELLEVLNDRVMRRYGRAAASSSRSSTARCCGRCAPSASCGPSGRTPASTSTPRGGRASLLLGPLHPGARARGGPAQRRRCRGLPPWPPGGVSRAQLRSRGIHHQPRAHAQDPPRPRRVDSDPDDPLGRDGGATHGRAGRGDHSYSSRSAGWSCSQVWTAQHERVSREERLHSRRRRMGRRSMDELTRRMREAGTCAGNACRRKSCAIDADTSGHVAGTRDAVRAAMLAEISPSTRAVGFWSAVLATVFSITYDVGQLAEWLGWLGSGGGPENPSTPLGLAILLTPSLLLGSSFLVLMVAVHQMAPPERRVWSHCALAFATVYTVLISINYFVQLTWVAPRLARGQTTGIEAFLFTPFDSFLYAVDILGYSFMSLATLFAANVFNGKGLERVARAFLIFGERLVDPVHRVADVSPRADIDRGALGGDVPWVDVVPGNPVPAGTHDCRSRQPSW